MYQHFKKRKNKITVCKDRKKRAWHLEYSVRADRFGVGGVAVRLCHRTERGLF